jgi:hypothetical protein
MLKAGYDLTFLEPPEPIPTTTYIMPGLVGLLIGIVASLGFIKIKPQWGKQG